MAITNSLAPLWRGLASEALAGLGQKKLAAQEADCKAPAQDQKMPVAVTTHKIHLQMVIDFHPVIIDVSWVAFF